MKTNLFIKLATLSVITLTTAYAGICDNAEEAPSVSYTHMTTAELQETVERLSAEDRLPFEMGLELIKRWTAKSRV
jgi:hypothetical protein